VQYLYMTDLLMKFLKTLERFLSPCRSQTNQKTRWMMPKSCDLFRKTGNACKSDA